MKGRRQNDMLTLRLRYASVCICIAVEESRALNWVPRVVVRFTQHVHVFPIALGATLRRTNADIQN